MGKKLALLLGYVIRCIKKGHVYYLERPTVEATRCVNGNARKCNCSDGYFFFWCLLLTTATQSAEQSYILSLSNKVGTVPELTRRTRTAYVVGLHFDQTSGPLTAYFLGGSLTGQRGSSAFNSFRWKMLQLLQKCFSKIYPSFCNTISIFSDGSWDAPFSNKKKMSKGI